MKIVILCSDKQHPVLPYLASWISTTKNKHDIRLISRKSELSAGNILFLVSCSEVISAEERALFDSTLVLHASDLPLGRGWSPHIWDIVNGADAITLSLLEAEDIVDSGRIWKKIRIPIGSHLLWDEINHLLFTAEIQLLDFALESFHTIQPVEQSKSITPTSHPKRTPEHSRIAPDESIASQFNKIRVCDPQRYPAFFEIHGHRYKLILERVNDE